MTTFGEVCKHGGLKRCCEICDLTEQVEARGRELEINRKAYEEAYMITHAAKMDADALRGKLEEARSIVLNLTESLEYVVDNFESEDRNEDMRLVEIGRTFLRSLEDEGKK